MVSPPIWMRSPGFSWRSSTRSPFTKVPFVLRRSRSRKLPFAPTISACRREASALGSRRLQLRLRPITTLDCGRSWIGGSGGKKSMALPERPMRFRSARGGRRFTRGAAPAPGPASRPRGAPRAPVREGRAAPVSARSAARSRGGPRAAPRTRRRALRARAAGRSGRSRPAPRPPRARPRRPPRRCHRARLRTQPATPRACARGAGRGAEGDALDATLHHDAPAHARAPLVIPCVAA